MVKKAIIILVCVIFLGVSVVMPVCAAKNDFYFSEFDKPYVTFLFDDGRMPYTSEFFEVFSDYDYPMTCAIIARDTDPADSVYRKSLVDVLHKIEDAGGEILSHGYDHVPVTSEALALDPNNSVCSNAVYTEAEIDDQFRRSYQVLTRNGFKVGGIIMAGCSDGCGTRFDKALVETITRRYYKYSDRYGESAQYNISRQWPSEFSQAKNYIDSAIKNNSWVILSAHQFGSGWGNIKDRETLEQILEYIKQKNVEIVTFADMYEKFGVYSGPEIPSVEMDLTPYPDEVTADSTPGTVSVSGNAAGHTEPAGNSDSGGDSSYSGQASPKDGQVASVDAGSAEENRNEDTLSDYVTASSRGGDSTAAGDIQNDKGKDDPQDGATVVTYEAVTADTGRKSPIGIGLAIIGSLLIVCGGVITAVLLSSRSRPAQATTEDSAVDSSADRFKN